MLSSIDLCLRWSGKQKTQFHENFVKVLVDSKQMKIYENAAFCEFAFFVRQRTKLFTFGRKSN